MKARLCAGAVDGSGNDECGKQYKNRRAKYDAGNTVRNKRTTHTHTGPHANA